MMPTECAFCPSPATTGEHLWSNWLNDLLGSKKRYRVTRTVGPTDAEVVHTWRAVGLHEKAPVLCNPCNNEWGSDIESKTKLVIADMACNGSPTDLSKADAMTIVKFTQMKAFVGDYMHDETRSPFHTRSERFAFRRDFTFPVTTQIWLGETSIDHGIWKVTYTKVPQDNPKRFETYIFTITVGRVVIQLVSSRWCKKSLRRYAHPPFLTQGNAWDSVSIEISSATLPFPVHWPPHVQLDRTLLNEFVYRWVRVHRAD